MRLLVTGGCGFIGSNFIQMVLTDQRDVVVVNLDKLTYAGNPLTLAETEATHGPAGDGRYAFVHGDIADPALTASLLKEYAIDAVVNFAAESHVDRSIHDPAPFVTTNVGGAQNLLHQAMQAGIERYVHVSTDEVYGTLGPEDPAFTEATPIAPNSPYAASKAGADLICRAYHETYGYPVVVTRCSNNYGPHQFPEKLIPLMLGKAAAGEPLPVYGDGTNVRDWIHVADHCKGVYLALTKGKPGAVYNFGGRAERTNLEVVRTILAALGASEELITFVADRPGHDKRYAMNDDLARAELGFTTDYTFERGIAETIAWYQTNTEWLESVKSGAYLEFMQQWYGARN